MTFYPFEDMFPELGSGFDFAEIGDIRLNAQKRRMTLHMRLSSLESFQFIDKIKKALKREYDLENIEVLIHLPDSTYNEGIDLAMKLSCKEFPSAAPFLEDCEKTVKGPIIELGLKRGRGRSA